jgi:hypothetical protein
MGVSFMAIFMDIFIGKCGDDGMIIKHIPTIIQLMG